MFLLNVLLQINRKRENVRVATESFIFRHFTLYQKENIFHQKHNTYSHTYYLSRFMAHSNPTHLFNFIKNKNKKKKKNTKQ